MLKHVSFVTADPDAVTSFYTFLGATLSKDVLTADGLRRLVLSFEGGGKLQFFALPVAGQQAPATARSELQTRVQDHPDVPVSASEVLRAPAPGQATAGYAWTEHVALVVPDLEASVQALKARGVHFSREPTLSPGGTRMAFVLDPDGRQVELLQGE